MKDKFINFRANQVRTTNSENQIQLTVGINCTPETAFDEFSSTKASYNKSDGVQFYHYVTYKVSKTMKIFHRRLLTRLQ